jgi:signal transduction histidine kinase
MFDRDGNYWAVNCPDVPCVRRPATIAAGQEGFSDRTGAERFDQPGPGQRMNAWSMLEDREGNLWIGTMSGLMRLRDSRLVTVALPSEMARRTPAIDADGTVWIGPNGQGTLGHLWRMRGDGTAEQVTRQPKHLLTTGRDGTILIGDDRAIERRRGARVLARYPLPDEVRGEAGKVQLLLLAEDRAGIWVYLSYHGMYYLRAGTWEPPSTHPWVNKAVFVTSDDAGRAWFGTRDNHVVAVDGATWRSYGVDDGLDIGAVTYIDTRHGLLVSGAGGTRLWQNGRFRPLLAEHADLANLAGLDATPDGDVWLNTADGLLHVRAADWRRSMDDPAWPLRGDILDGVDGFPGRVQPKSVTSTVRQAPDGKLWVTGTDGVAWVNPVPARAAAPPPRVEVTALHANGASYPGGAAGSLPPGTARLSVDYTALTLSVPERVRFRYRLVGADAGWQDAGTARTAYYTNLPPGDYRFEVAALDADGMPGPVVATPAFDIRPTIVQSRWFAGLCIVLAGLAAYLLYLWRLARIKQTLQERMEAQWIARVMERARIARTLHDTFLQNLHSLILRLDTLSGRLAPGSSERVQLDSLLEAARAVGEEGRSQVLDLRVAADGDLATALVRDADALRTDDRTELAVRELGHPRPLDPDVRLEVHSIAREAVSNAFRHARARRIEVVLDWRGAALVVSVTDDGIGMGAELLAHGRPGHWGLTGMRERAARIGAALDVRQQPCGGIGIVLDLARQDR